MELPEDFQFADNFDVHTFAENCASMMFGENWKVRKNLSIDRPFPGWVVISDALNANSVRVATKNERARYAVFCVKNDLMEDPLPNRPAHSEFDCTGKLLSQSHHLRDALTNPPDGTPARIRYKYNGTSYDGWYVVDADPAGKLIPGLPASKKEIAKRISAAKKSSAAALCDGSQDIVALRPGSSHPAMSRSGSGFIRNK